MLQNGSEGRVGEENLNVECIITMYLPDGLRLNLRKLSLKLPRKYSSTQE